MHWRRKWQPTPVFLRGESQGWGSLVGCRLCLPEELQIWVQQQSPKNGEEAVTLLEDLEREFDDPGQQVGTGSLMGCRLWGRTESDTTEVI